MVAKGMTVLSLVLVLAVMSPVNGQLACAVTSLTLNVVCVVLQCDLSAVLQMSGCASTSVPVLNIDSGNYQFSLSSSASFGGLNISATGSAAVNVNINSTLNLAANGLAVLGSAVVNVAKGVVVTVQGDVNVAAGATINVAGNLTVQGKAAIQGTINFAGTAAAGAAQTAWVVAKSTAVTIAGNAAAAAQVTGNGAIDGSVNFNGNANLGSSSASSSTSLTVTGNFNVNTGAVLQLASNATVAGAATVSGTIHFVGTQAAEATAWLIAKANAVSLSGSASAAVIVSGNGGFDADVTCNTNVTLAAGNSPGTVFINGNFEMSSTTTMEVDVASRTSFDKYIISKTFHRDGILFVHFLDYTPDNGDNFIFATHSSSSGSFNLVHGDFDSTLNKIHEKDATLTTAFQYGNGIVIAVPVLLIAFVASALIL